MITVSTWKTGFKSGLKTSAMLLKIILPVYVFVTILGYTPVIKWMAAIFEPVMKLTGLPGEAAIAFVTGALVNIYAAMGIIMALDLTPYQMTILALMLNFSHELIVESAVLKKAGVNASPVIITRLASAFLVGTAMNYIGKLF